MDLKTAHTKSTKQDSSINTTNINENSGISGTLSRKPPSAIPKMSVTLQDDRDKLLNGSYTLDMRK